MHNGFIRPFLIASLLAVFSFIPATAIAASPPGFETQAEILLPTVVNVSTTAKIKNGDRPELPQVPDFPPGSPFEQFFKDFYDQYKNADPQAEEKISALGSGFIIDAEKGYIVTNNHVIKDADEIKIILHDDTSLDATLVGTDEKTDIAVLKIDTKSSLAAAKWGDSDTAKIGSWILAIGNPFGLGGTVTAGIVSARQRDINAGPYDDFIQTDASINRGNSGGPLFNVNGEVIGVNTAIFSPSGGSVGIGFAIPSNLAKNVVDQLIKYGKTKRGWLGVRIQEVTPEIAESLGLDGAKGALVSGVTPNGPAEAAGIKSGDVILAFNGNDLDQMNKLPRMVAESEVGKAADVTVWRKGDKKNFSVVLGQLEKAEEDGTIETAGKSVDEKPVTSAIDIDALDMKVLSLNDKLRKQYDIAKTVKGVLIAEVKKGGVAAEKGLIPGDVIVEIDQQEVSDPKDIIKKTEEARKSKRNTLLLFIARKGDMRFVALKLKK